MKVPPMPGGELEYAVLGVIWDFGTRSAPEIYARLGQPKGLAYTTIAKVLDRLCAKGLVSRVRRGKSFTYTAKCSRDRIDHARASGNASEPARG